MGTQSITQNWIGAFDVEITAAPATDGTCIGPGTRLFVLISVSYNMDAASDPNTSGSAAHSRRKAFHAPTAAADPWLPPTTRPEVSESLPRQSSPTG